ncbi:acyl-CoA dehydrogenase family protein [Rhodococcus qingshengii]|uniref:acyl-CoA dehydrogenase family protein n=1 Tax=Rhodococcus qingshengii TaxID=334542 RepID=UPI0024B9895C|nr:acyl-CoA dehydrogenase family protein [Rhodococcus qingshengii]MDJ0490922.1 acyl-CoA dehydrogenase family protein [Rhodococcus qingshengii]
MFTDEHHALRKVIRRWVEQELEPHVDAWEEEGNFPDSVFRRAGELGLLGLHYDEKWGGSGGDYLTAVVLAEELSRCGCGAIPMALAVQSEMATPAIARFGTDWQKENYLAPAIAGTKIAAIAITEPGAGSDVAGIRSRAVRDGDDYLISGSKTYITNGTRADFMTFVATTDTSAKHRGIGLFLIDTDLPGFSVARKLKKVGMRSSDTAEIFLDNVRVPARNLIGEQEGKGFSQLMAQLQLERLVNAVLSVSQAQVSLDETIEFVRNRKAFGSPLGAHQVVAHKLADAATELAAARALVYSVAQQVEDGVPDDLTVSMAKKYAAQVQCRVADTCVQLHGGAGYMDEYRVSRQWRDSRLQRIGAGADEVMNEIIAKRLGIGASALRDT